MNLKENIDIDIDLVFICSQSLKNLNDFNKKDNKLIFESSYWEEVFCKWIKIIIEEKINIRYNYLSNKKFFSLSFHIVDNQEISILNKKWLNREGPTDVLSFPILIEKELKNDLLFVELGDLFISLEKASIQALDFSNTVKREMLFLASHGFLHLLGWSHDNEKQLKSMLNFQEYLISKLSS